MYTTVYLRKKKISLDRESLYLDFYPPLPHPTTGKLTRREFLGYYLKNKPKTQDDIQENFNSTRIAEQIRILRELQLNGKVTIADKVPFDPVVKDHRKRQDYRDMKYKTRLWDSAFMAGKYRPGSNKEGELERILEKEFLNLREAAIFLNCSLGTIYKYIKTGKIKTQKLGERVYIVKRADLECFMEL